MKKLVLFASAIVLSLGIYSFTNEHNNKGKHDQCPPEGKANPKKGKHAELKPREKDLNIHINRNTTPQKSDIDYSVTIDKMCNSKDDSIWSEEKAAVLTGYVYAAALDKPQSCNCFTEDKSKYNIKLYISPTPIKPETRAADCIIAFLTPYSLSLNHDWTIDNINMKMRAQKVTVTGWLIYDYLHSSLSIETNSNGEGPDRRTIWGLCPTTDIQLIKN